MTSPTFDFKTFVRITRLLLLDFNTYSDFLTDSSIESSSTNALNLRAHRRIRLRYWLLYHRLNPVYPYFNDIEKAVFASIYDVLNQTEAKYKHLLNPDQLEHYEYEAAYLPQFLLDASKAKDSVYSGPFLDRIHRELLDFEYLQSKNKTFVGESIQYIKDSYLLAQFILRYPIVRLIKSKTKDPLIDGLLKGNRKFHSVWDGIDTSSDVLSYYVFRKGIRAALKGQARIAELTFLTIQLGDELIDQLSIQIGVNRMMGIIHDDKTFFSIEYDSWGNRFYVPTSIEQFEQQGINMDAFNDKFKITYRELLTIIIRILERINQLLLKTIRPQEAAHRIHFCFVHCLSTYYDDLYINECNAATKYQLEHTKWYYYKKTNAVLIVWLVLRACLFDLDPIRYRSEIKEWGYLLNNLQIYDDLKDMKVDFDFQPNLAHIVAYQHFPSEFEWFTQHRDGFKENIRIDEIIQIGLEMPATIANVMIIARKEAVVNLRSFTLLMANYCWKRNWSQSFMNFYNSKKIYPLLDHPVLKELKTVFSTENRNVDLFFICLTKTQSAFQCFENKAFYFDYLFNLCLYDGRFRLKFHLTHSPLQTFYMIRRFHYLKTGHKERLLFSMLKPYRKEVRKGLEIYSSLPHYNHEIDQYIRMSCF